LTVLPPSPAPSNLIAVPEEYIGTYSATSDGTIVTIGATSWTLGDSSSDFSVSFDAASTSVYTITDMLVPSDLLGDPSWGELAGFLDQTDPTAEFQIIYYIDFTSTTAANLHLGLVWLDQAALDGIAPVLAAFFPVPASVITHPTKSWNNGVLTGPNAFIR
jgi:hypothetical protein